VVGYQFEMPLSAINDYSRGGNHVIFLAFKLTSKPQAIKQFRSDDKKGEGTPAKSTKN
jgi:hypothetical protein